MINLKNKYSFKIVSRVSLVLALSAAFLAACGSNETNLNDQAKINTVSSNLTDSTQHQASPLLKSLNALYPNGKVPADQSEVAAVKRTQSADSGTSIASSFGSSALTSALFGLTKDQDVESVNAQSAVSAPILPQAGAIYSVISRVQNTSLYGAYFFTIYPSERTAALTNNPNWNYEGPAFSASLVSDVDLFPVHRFRNLQNGSYLYTIYETERNAIAANLSSTFFYEGIAWHARQTPSAGWKPLYRFRNVVNGTYLFSAYEDEKNAIIANFPAVFELEGTAYFVKEPDAIDKYLGAWRICTATGNTLQPTHMLVEIALNKVSANASSGQIKVLSTYRDSSCNTVHSSQVNTFPYSAKIVGTKTASGFMVDTMDTLFNGSLIKDIYYTKGRELFLGGTSVDAQGYPTGLINTSYYLQ